MHQQGFPTEQCLLCSHSHLHEVLLTDIEDCEVSGQDDDEGFLRVFPQRLVRTILVSDKAALVIRIGENYALD